MPKRRNAHIKEYKLKSGVTKYMFKSYVGIDPITGKQINIEKRGFTNYEEANAAYNELQIKIAKGNFLKENEGKELTFNELYQLWWKDYAAGVRTTSANKTESWFRLRILPAFGKMYVNKITPGKVQTVINHWSTEIVRYKTFGNYFSRVMRFGVILGVVDSNPYDRVVVPKHGKKSNRHADNNYWEPETLIDFLKFLESKPIDVLAMFRAYAMTGLRRGELIGLTWNDVDFKEQTISVHHSINYNEKKKKVELGPTKSPAGNRVVPLDLKTVQILKEWKHVQQLISENPVTYSIDQLLFTNTQNALLNPNEPTELFTKLVKESGLKRITLHGLRHTYATFMYALDKNITPKDMQRLLGHESVDISMNLYTHSTDAGQENVKKFLNEEINF